MITAATYSAFSSEMQKIAKSKLKKKLSGETTLDPDNFSRQLEDATKTTPRGPHPALNYGHTETSQR